MLQWTLLVPVVLFLVFTGVLAVVFYFPALDDVGRSAAVRLLEKALNRGRREQKVRVKPCSNGRRCYHFAA